LLRVCRCPVRVAFRAERLTVITGKHRSCRNRRPPDRVLLHLRTQCHLIGSCALLLRRVEVEGARSLFRWEREAGAHVGRTVVRLNQRAEEIAELVAPPLDAGLCRAVGASHDPRGLFLGKPSTSRRMTAVRYGSASRCSADRMASRRCLFIILRSGSPYQEVSSGSSATSHSASILGRRPMVDPS
jgi:hypothetical protein